MLKDVSLHVKRCECSFLFSLTKVICTINLSRSQNMLQNYLSFFSSIVSEKMVWNVHVKPLEFIEP